MEFWAAIKAQHSPALLDTSTYSCYFDYYASIYSLEHLNSVLTGVVINYSFDSNIIEKLEEQGIVLTDRLKRW